MNQRFERGNHLERLDFARIQAVFNAYSIRIASVHTLWHFRAHGRGRLVGSCDAVVV